VTELIVGRVLSVDDHPGARAPSFLLRVDLGGRGERDAQMEPGDYNKDELVGRMVIVSVDDEAIVLAARSHDGPRLVVPDGDVAPGTVVA
jgi:tRNA-binding EMAP/Myf-like protein